MPTLTSTNPARDYDILGTVAVSDPSEITDKVARAREAQASWFDIGLDARIDYLKKLAEVFKAHRKELIERPIEEMGAPRRLTRSLAEGAERTFAWFLENAHDALKTELLFDDGQEVNELVYEPHGVMACIVAWNFPYPNFVHSVVQPLLGGNTVVMKYSEEVPLFSKYLEELIAEAHLPEGIVNFVYGDGGVGAALVDQDIDIISFTGSYATGQKLYQKAAEKFIPIINELGGSSPGIVFENCNLDNIVPDIFWGRFDNSAQFCDGLKRLIVHESLFESCVEKLAAYAKKQKVGDPQDSSTRLGPLVAKRQVDALKEQLQDALDKGAELICGGQAPEGLLGAYYEPTLLTNITQEMRVWKEEVFGPILPIVSFRTYDEAIALANDTMYGLSAFIFTNDNELAARATKDLKAGCVSTQGTHFYRPQNPFGGYKKSGMGRTCGVAGFRGSVQMKTVARRK